MFGANKNNNDDDIQHNEDDHQNVERQSLISSSTYRPTWYGRIQVLFQTNFYFKMLLINLQQIRKNKGRYSLGFLSCFIVVLVISLLMTVLVKSPIVFLTLAEAETGEIDVIMYVQSTRRSMFNFTLVEKLVEEFPDYQYLTPRMDFYVSTFSQNDCPDNLDPFDPKWKYEGLVVNDTCVRDRDNCFPSMCPEAETYQSKIFIIDSKKEEKMHLGREWIAHGYGEIPSGEVFVSSDLAVVMGLAEGDVMYLKFNVSEVLGDLYRLTVNQTTREIEFNNPNKLLATINRQFVYLPFKVNTVFNGPQGKTSSYDTETMLVEYKHFLPHLAAHLHTLLPLEAKEVLAEVNFYEYASFLVWNLPPNRVDTYINTDYDAIRNVVVQFASQVAYKVGFSQIYTDCPVINSLYQTRYLSLFLGLVLYVIIFILLLLATLLVYSLLTIDVQTREFEMAVMRSMGIPNSRLVYILLLQAFMYAIPSWIIGLVVSQLAAVGIIGALNHTISIQLSTLLTGEAILTATVIVFAVPLFASVFPIRDVLGQSVQSNLDRSRSKTKAVEISIERSESASSHFSASNLIIGTSFALFGVSIYYLFPYSLLSGNLAILLYILVFLLIGMILGLVILSLNLDHMLGRVLIPLLFWWDSATTRTILVKNMIAHRIRNQKTTIMYSLSLGFIIFLSVSYDLQAESFQYRQQKASGVFLRVYSSGREPGTNTANRIHIVADLERFAEQHPQIVDTAWATLPLENALDYASDIQISNVGHAFSTGVQVAAVSANFFDVTMEKFQTFYDQNGKAISGHDMLQKLYSLEGSAGMLIGSYQAKQMGVFKNNEHILFSYHNGTDVVIKRLKPVAVADSSPYYDFSKFPTAGSRDAVVSLTTYMKLSEGNVKSLEDVPMNAFFFKLKPGTSVGQVNAIKSQLMSLFVRRGQRYLRIWDYNQAVVRSKLGEYIMTYIFSFAIVVAMIICFFSLMSSMYSNINEQSKEIGVLRVLGTTKWWMYRVYTFEAFIVVFSSSLMGVIIGTLVGYTMLLQRILWTQLPIPFTFPYELVIVVFLLSVLFAFLSSWKPVQNLMRKPIVVVLRQ